MAELAGYVEVVDQLAQCRHSRLQKGSLKRRNPSPLTLVVCDQQDVGEILVNLVGKAECNLGVSVEVDQMGACTNGLPARQG